MEKLDTKLNFVTGAIVLTVAALLAALGFVLFRAQSH